MSPFSCTLAFSARVDFNPSDPCYVFKIVTAADSSSVAISVSSGHVKTYQLHDTGLTYVGDLLGHTGRITDVSFPFAEAPHIVFSSSTDKTLRAWDLRAAQQIEGYTAPGELNSFSVHEHLIAAGGEAGGDGGGDVIFWDRRTKGIAGRFTDTHMDAVTQVKFHAPSRRLVSASIDGLIAVYDISAQLSEDDGFLAAQNFNTSIEEIQFYSTGGKRLWCRTGTESLHLWDWLSATQEDTEDGSIPLLDMTDARGDVAAVLAHTPVAQSFQQVDYLLGCHHDDASSRLLLAAGTCEGSIAMCTVNEAAGDLSNPCPPLDEATCTFQHGHEAVVRSLDFVPLAAGKWVCLSGGEDARVCCWQLQPTVGAHASPSLRHAQRTGHQHLTAGRVSPY